MESQRISATSQDTKGTKRREREILPLFPFSYSPISHNASHWLSPARGQLNRGSLGTKVFAGQTPATEKGTTQCEDWTGGAAGLGPAHSSSLVQEGNGIFSFFMFHLTLPPLLHLLVWCRTYQLYLESNQQQHQQCPWKTVRDAVSGTRGDYRIRRCIFTGSLGVQRPIHSSFRSTACKSGQLPVFLSKGFWVKLFRLCLVHSYFCRTIAELGTCDRECIAHKA